MALTYEESAALMNDSELRGRVKVACLNYATYISGEPASTPAHNSRVRWSQMTFQNPEMVAQQVQPPTVMTDEVQTAGKDVTDVDLQTAVETVVNKIM